MRGERSWRKQGEGGGGVFTEHLARFAARFVLVNASVCVLHHSTSCVLRTLPRCC